MSLRLNTFRAQKTVHHRVSECGMGQRLCYKKYTLNGFVRDKTKTDVIEKAKEKGFK